MAQLTKVENDDLKARVAKINDYIWSRYVEVTDDYQHQIDEDEALEDLQKNYDSQGEQGSPDDIVYLGILLFERGFVDEDNKLDYFKRAYQIFQRYRRMTGETDWDVVEDRLEDINSFFEDEKIDPEAELAEEEDTTPENMVLVPAGPFLFGPNREATELAAFYIDVAPVTNAEYMEFCDKTGYRKPRFHDDPRFNQPNQPVVGISVVDAMQYCEYHGKSLPNEHQWEKAARGTDGRRYPWGEDTPDEKRAHFEHDMDAGRPADVRTLEDGVSPFGCYDMAGNVWEWTTSPPAADGAATNVEDLRVARGGCYEDSADFLTTFGSIIEDQKTKSEIVGFRCVKKVG